MKVLFFFRKTSVDFNSIEMLFSGLFVEFEKYFLPEIYHVPSSRANFAGIFRNCLFAFKNRGTIVHVTGHVNYLAIFTGKRTILTIHDVGSSIPRRWPYSRLFDYFWLKLPIFCSKRVTVVSEFTRKEVLKFSPDSINKIRIIPNSVDPRFIFDPLNFNCERPIILVVGTKANKNLERIIAALDGLNCELVVLGKLDSGQRSLLQKHNITYRNKFGLSFQGVLNLYRECDLLCFPSTYEGFGLPILEAQAIGRPVLTSDLGAMKEIAETSACLVDPYDIMAIRKGIEKLILDIKFRESLIQKGLENVKKYSVESIAQKYYSLYREVESE